MTERITDPHGRFRIVPHRREFFVDGRAVELGGRAFDTLLILIDGRGLLPWLGRWILGPRLHAANQAMFADLAQAARKWS